MASQGSTGVSRLSQMQVGGFFNLFADRYSWGSLFGFV